MKPVGPVCDGVGVIYIGEKQNEFETLPAIFAPIDGFLLSRWTFTDEERKQIAEGADLFLFQYTYGKPMQPLYLSLEEPDLEGITLLTSEPKNL